jgi:hypothetical protein
VWPTPNREDFLFYVERNGDLPANKTWEYGSAYLDTIKYPNHKLVYVTPQEPDKWSRWYYAASREDQDLYNFEFAQFPIAGFRLDAVFRSYVSLRDTFDPLTPVRGGAMPDVPEGMFTNEWILFDIEQKRTGDKELDSLFVEERHIYFQRYTNKEYTYDDFFGAPLYETQYICHADESVYDFLTPPTPDPAALTVAELFDDPENVVWGLQDNGKFRGGARLNDEWYLLFERDTVPPWMVGDEGGRTYVSTIDFSWPAVLGGVTLDAWPLRAGGQEIYPRVFLSKEAYRGATRCSVFQQFFKDATTGEAALGLFSILNPTPIQFSCPYFNLSIGPTLHVGDTIDINVGTENPKYAYAADTWVFDATNYTDWPDEMVASDELKPFRGGFLREQITVYKPEFLEPPP